MQDRRSLGKWLKVQRRALDLTQEEVAQRAQCSADTVRKLEAGSRRASKEVANHLADALELVGDERSAFLRLARSQPDDELTAHETAAAFLPQHQPVPLLATKLYMPRPRTQLVARPRLLARLEAGLHRPLTLVAAPAGFGKTTILVDWLNGPAPTSRHVSWLALDAGDSAPILFLRYLITALQKLAPSIAASMEPLLHSAQQPPLESLLPMLANDLTHAPDSSILVLDDYHAVDSPAVHQILSFLLDHLPPQLHVVIASRADPLLPLARLRVRGQLTELRASDLRFTEEEASAFLAKVMNVQLSAADVAALEARTEGWIAGLQLAALSLQEIPKSQISAFIESFTGSHRFVVDYLVDEVLGNQPVHVQNFLRCTSILDHFCASLCDAVVGTTQIASQLLLEQLERANLFLVPLDDERRWYRYHHLFAQVLHERLANHVSPVERAELHHRAALWYEEHGVISQAIKHFLAAQEWEDAARLIQVCGQSLIMQGQAHIVAGWIKLLPDALLESHPYLVNLQALIYFSRNDLEEAEKLLQTEEEILARHGVNDDTRTLLAHSLMGRATIARARGDFTQCVAFCHQVLESLPATAIEPRPAAMLGIAQSFFLSGDVGHANKKRLNEAIAMVQASGNLMTIFNSSLTWAEFQRRQGHLAAAAASYQKTAEVAPHHIGLAAQANGASFYCGFGHLLRELNQVDEAEQLLLQAQELIRLGRQAHGDFVTLGYITLARLQFNQGYASVSRATLAELQTIAQQRNYSPSLTAHARAAEAHLAMLIGDLPTALRWAETNEPRLSGKVNYLHEPEHLVLARIRIAQARRDRTTALLSGIVERLNHLLANATANLRLDSVIQIQVVRALALYESGDQATACKVLAEAIEQAEPEGYIRVFVDEGAAIVQLLSLGLRAVFTKPPVRQYAETLLKVLESEGIRQEFAASAQSSSTRSPLAGGESLTAREMEVLRLLATGSSNQAIARELIVELGTVKRHVSNIMVKLQVQSRLEAVARARALGII